MRQLRIIRLIALASLFGLIPATPTLAQTANDAIDATKASIVEQHDLSMRGMIRLVHETPEQFEKIWNERRRQQQQVLAHNMLASKALQVTQEIDWQWAAGLINYPYFRQRETGQGVADDWQPRLQALQSIPFNDETSLGKPLFDQLIQAWLHDEAGRRIKQDSALKLGDNRWLRANFDALEAHIRNAKVKAYFMAKLLAEHIDDNGAKNLTAIIGRFEQQGGDAAQVTKFSTAATQEMAEPKDHRAFTYQSVDGVDLQVHVFQALSNKDANKEKTPVLIWFHGGSWSTGHWSYCPVICRSLQNRGFAIVQVEYRTSQRFDGTPLNALADAYKAIDWTIANAAQLNLDTQKLMVAGFSSGGALASQMAIFNSDKVKAAAYMSGGFDPANDTWYNSVVGPLRDTKKLSPLRMVHAKSPPQIIFHAKDDEMCPYRDAEGLQQKLKEYQINNQLISFEQGGHFFVFKNPADRQRINKELNSFLDQLHW